MADDGRHLRVEWPRRRPRPQAAAGTAQARVVMVQARRCPVSKHWAGLERKRRTLWHNEPRNLAVAAAARAVRGRDLKALRALGARVRKEDLPKGRVGKKVVVLAESTEHGNALLGLLPGWEMLDAVPVEYPEGYAPDDDGDEDAEPPAGWVVTLVYATLHGVEAGVLIRATGGRGKLCLRGFPPGEGVTAGVPLVVDVADDFDGPARMDTEVRVRDYKQRGWAVVEPAAPARRQ